MPKILYLRLLVMIIEAVWNGFGTKWAFTPKDYSCEPQEVILPVQVCIKFIKCQSSFRDHLTCMKYITFILKLRYVQS